MVTARTTPAYATVVPDVTKKIFFTLFVLQAIVSACGKSDRSHAPDSLVVQPSVSPASATPRPEDTVPGAGRLNWSLSDLEMALRRAGVNAVRNGPIRQPFMGPTGMSFRLPGGELQAYLYADAVALGRDTDKLDTTSVSPPGMKINWVMPASLITENNLALFLLTRDARLKERITRTIEAKAVHGGHP